MKEEIYYKEGEHINNKKEFILNFLPKKDGIFPPTYYKKTGFLQCRSTHRRSFSDIFWLFKSKFKTATKGELARILLDRQIYPAELVYCDTIRKLVVNNIEDSMTIGASFVNEDSEETDFFLQKHLLKQGPSFEQVVKYAIRSKDFDVNNIHFGLEKHKKKFLK